MIAGHFGLAVGAKAAAPRVPLWALLVSTFLLDFIFFVLFPAGIESLSQTDSTKGSVIIHAYYTHSLVGALVIATVVGWVASRWWGRRGGVVIAVVVWSHWLLDLLVHRPDLPILPANAGDLPLLGLGLWQVPVVSILLELALIIGGVYLYYRTATQLPMLVATSRRNQRRRVLTVSGVTTVLLLLLLVTDTLGL